MPIKVTCNSCGGVLHAPDDSAGKRGRCPTCGLILTIPADAPRVPAESVPAAGASPGYAVAPEPLAFPKAPAFGDDAKASFSQRSPTAPAGAYASRLPTDPRRGDPFAKPGKTPQAAATEAVARRWTRVDRGLGLIRTGVFCIALGFLLPTLAQILEQNGVPFPQKDPGYLEAPGLSFANEIKCGLAVAFLFLGGLFIVFGRFRVAALPGDTGAKGVATASAFATFLAFAGFTAVLFVALSATLNQAPPRLVPHSDILGPNMKLQDRVQGYVQHLFLGSDDLFGQIQRIGALSFLVGGVLAELWFLGTLSRLAAWLHNARALGRVNRFAVAAGFLILIVALAWLAYDLFGQDAFSREVRPKWDGMGADNKNTARAAVTAGLVVILAFIYARSLGGLRTAIREAAPA